MVSFQAHNFFVQTLFNTGIVGLLSVLWMLVWLVRRIATLMKEAIDTRPYALLLVLLSGQILYFCFYGITIASGLLFGLLFSASYGSRSKEAPKPKVWAPYAGRSNQSWVAK